MGVIFFLDDVVPSNSSMGSFKLTVFAADVTGEFSNLD